MGEATVKIRRVRNGAKLPSYGTDGAAGADLRACIDMPVTIEPGQTAIIPTGLQIEIPEGYAGFVFARSGLASKKGLAPANKVGVIDSDYRGEILVAVLNHGSEAQTVTPGERIAQLVVMPVARCRFVEDGSLAETARGGGGFGSTGTH